MTIAKERIETAYCFFHQKWRVYEYSHCEKQKDDIEYAISTYVESMDESLLNQLSGGKKGFLQDHTLFSSEMPEAVCRLEQMLNE